MTRSTPARRLRRAAPAALLTAIVATGLLPGAGLAIAPARERAEAGRAEAGEAGEAAVALTAAAPGPTADPQVTAADTAAKPQTSSAYEAWLAHENDKIAFEPGSRVSVGFTPRSTDQWSVGGVAPTTLPAGRATGTSMAASRQGSAWAASTLPITTSTLQTTSPGATVAPMAASGLRRQVFGFLPYWELSGASTSLNYSTLTTIAYFSVGADAAGNLKKKNADGSLTTGWGGWTSSAMTSVINAAHSHGTRVVLTASVFAWSSGGIATQRALLNSATARANFAKQLTAAVRDRGADGVNLDFEPLVSGQEAHFVALLKTLRTDLNAIKRGYQITYDTTGYIGNYPLEASVGSATADAVFIMGYDYRTDGAGSSGSIDPLSGPSYDLADTVRQYTARIDPSRVILGVPWYGRAWSTSTASPRSTNISGAKYGYSTAVNYENIPALVAKYGRKWDAVEQSPYIAYQRQNCTSTYGCVTSWRQVWYDDAQSLGLRYQLVNGYGLRGAGMWALGYQGAYQDMVKALSDAFLVDHAAPEAGIKALPIKYTDEGIVVSWAAADVSTVSKYDLQVSIDGGAWTAWLTGVAKTSDVYMGADGHAYAFRVRATDSKGNVGAWNATSTAGAAPADLAKGGFGRVTADGLAYRAGPDTSAARLGSLPAGTVVALTSGPVSADGSTWFEITQPIKEWTPVSFVERGVWVAAKTGTTANIVPFHAPNATVVDAGIVGFDFGTGGLTGTSAAAIAGRSFSPNADGTRDALRLRWTSTLAFDSLVLNVLRPDGTALGSVPLPASALAVGAHAFDWPGTLAGTPLADGTYALQLIGMVGTRPYRAPSSQPVAGVQVARLGVIVDTVAPTIGSSSASSSLVSPNADGLRDSASFALTASGAAAWQVTVAQGAATPIRTVTGKGGSIAFTWDGKADDGAPAPDGTYAVTLAACDAAGNCARKAYSVRIDTTPPTVTASAAPALFSPNGDGAADRAALRWSSSERASGTVSVYRGSTLVRRWTAVSASAGSVAWDGRNASGALVAEGPYTVKVDVRDAAGNRTVATSTVVVDRTAGTLRWSRSFYPQDGDSLAPSSAISWRQTRTAASTLGIYDATGALVRVVWTNRSLAAGVHSWTWNGKLADGSYAPQGQYIARVEVVSPYGTQTLTRSVWAAAFRTSLSAATVRAGQTLTVRFAAIEALRTTPRVTFTQPGLAGVTVTATRLADGSYRASFVVKAGAAGAATVRILATDTGGHANATVTALAMAQ
ncbi:MAG: FlgD immunoglobulin-like domain containing protein [Chloroflexota bacterium]